MWRRTAGTLRLPLVRGQVSAILVTSVVSSLYGIVVAIASASLLFAGPLSGGLAMGAGAALLGTVITSALIGAMSGLPCNVPQVQSMSFVVLALTLGATAARLNAPPETMIGTAFMIIAMTTATSGAVLIITGRLGAGRMVKFFPLEVLSGFVAGTGWLLITGAMSVMTGLSPSLNGWLGLQDRALLTQFMPAVLFGMALTIAMTFFRHSFVMLIVMGLGIGLFYLWLYATGGTVAEAIAAGYLPNLEHGVTASLPFPAMFDHVDWITVAVAMPGAVSVAILTLLAGLLNISAVEHASGEATDIDAELRTAGIGNVLSAMAGSPPSNTGLATSILAVRLGVKQRGVGLVTAAGVFVAIFFVEDIVAHVPRYVSAGLLVYFGASMLKEWLIDTWHRYSQREWWVVMIIVLMVASYGFLTAILVGFLIATMLFVWSYANVPVIRSQTTLDNLPSSHDRTTEEAEVLSQQGNRVTVIRLQGFLFFGTAERLVVPVRRAVREGEALAVVMDFTAVTRVDTASTNALARLAKEVLGRDCRLLLCGMSQDLTKQVLKTGMVAGKGTGVEIVETLDRALESMENMLLSRFLTTEAEEHPDRSRWSAAQLDEDLSALQPVMTPRHHKKGSLVVRAGTAPDGLGLLATGRVEINLPGEGPGPVHLRTATPGMLIGDIGFTLGIPRTANVLAQEECLIYWITAEQASWLETHSPVHAAALNRLIARSLARKVISANRLTKHLRT